MRCIRRARLLILLALAFLALAPFEATADGNRVDLQLVLAVDVSRSITDDEFKLQRQGYAAALTDRRVLSAVTGGPYRSIALTFIEYAGAAEQKVVVDWTVIDDSEAAAIFADRILAAPRSFYGRTAIGSVIDVAVERLSTSGFFSERQVIDVSGDGTNNSGRDLQQARDDAVAAGITINGLAIINNHPTTWNPDHTHPPGGLPLYYSNNVVGGMGSFLIVVEDFHSFAEAITKKLIAEIAGLTPNASVQTASTLPPSGPAPAAGPSQELP